MRKLQYELRIHEYMNVEACGALENYRLRKYFLGLENSDLTSALQDLQLCQDSVLLLHS
jgi:hypothetical protein